jgi:hypothetical protein
VSEKSNNFSSIYSIIPSEKPSKSKVLTNTFREISKRMIFASDDFKFFKAFKNELIGIHISFSQSNKNHLLLIGSILEQYLVYYYLHKSWRDFDFKSDVTVQKGLLVIPNYHSVFEENFFVAMSFTESGMLNEKLEFTNLDENGFSIFNPSWTVVKNQSLWNPIPGFISNHTPSQPRFFQLQLESNVRFQRQFIFNELVEIARSHQTFLTTDEWPSYFQSHSLTVSLRNLYNICDVNEGSHPMTLHKSHLREPHMPLHFDSKPMCEVQFLVVGSSYVSSCTFQCSDKLCSRTVCNEIELLPRSVYLMASNLWHGVKVKFENLVTSPTFVIHNGLLPYKYRLSETDRNEPIEEINDERGIEQMKNLRLSRRFKWQGIALANGWIPYDLMYANHNNGLFDQIRSQEEKNKIKDKFMNVNRKFLIDNVVDQSDLQQCNM